MGSRLNEVELDILGFADNLNILGDEKESVFTKHSNVHKRTKKKKKNQTSNNWRKDISYGNNDQRRQKFNN